MYVLSNNIWGDFKQIFFTDNNQSSSTDFNEQDIVDKSKLAQLGQFNDIDNGNASTVFYGGIIFPSDFDFDDNNNVPNMSYTIRFGRSYTEYDTDTLYSHGIGPGNSGMQKMFLILRWIMSWYFA